MITPNKKGGRFYKSTFTEPAAFLLALFPMPGNYRSRQNTPLPTDGRVNVTLPAAKVLLISP